MHRLPPREINCGISFPFKCLWYSHGFQFGSTIFFQHIYQYVKLPNLTASNQKALKLTHLLVVSQIPYINQLYIARRKIKNTSVLFTRRIWIIWSHTDVNSNKCYWIKNLHWLTGAVIIKHRLEDKIKKSKNLKCLHPYEL